MNNLFHLFQAGGFVMWPLLLLSLIAFYTIVDRVIMYRSIRGKASGLLDLVLEPIQNGDITGAAQALEKKTGVMADCLRVALEYRHLPVPQVEKVIQEVGEEQFNLLDEKLVILETSATISPLLGLLGTLVGMIATFQAISTSHNAAENNAILAGVGQALYATATGLSIAVICFVAFNYFSSRQRAIIGETELAITKLMNTLIESKAIGGGPEEKETVPV